MKREAAAWVAELQARFGDAIRTPLERASGRLTARVSAYDKDLVESLGGLRVGAKERLAVYNRQYWFRLFDALQNAFPLTARMLGYWSFNEYAERFLVARPPRGCSLDEVAGGFDTFFTDTLALDDASFRQGLVECARIDAAWRTALAAERTAVFRPSETDAGRLLDAHLALSPAVRIVGEQWPLVELRRRIARQLDTGSLALPAPLVRPQWWAIAGTDAGVGTIPLEPREAELLVLLGQLSVRDALAQLEHACTVEERAHLPARTRAWLARSVTSGFWSAVRFER